MKLGEILEFKRELYFEGAVQADWFYDREKAVRVAENFVFHGSDYFGGEDEQKKTIDTISLVKELAGKLEDDQSNPLTLTIADYGTGKSHFAVTLGQLFSGYDYMPETFNKIIENINSIDEESALLIKESCYDRNFVMVINGMRDFNLHYEILRAAEKSLRLYGLPIECLRKLNRTLETAELFFSRNKGIQLSLFETAAEQHGWNEKGEYLLSRLETSLMTDDTAFSIINDVYAQITGKAIRWDEGISARAILEMLISEYCGMNGQFDHVIILFDEFGRYLEYASSSGTAKSGDSALQQMFETAQDSGGVLHLINFIQSDIKSYLLRVDQTKNISRYIGRYDQSDKYHVSSNLETVFANLINRKDKEAFLSIIQAWQNEREGQWESVFKQINRWLMAKGIWKNYKLFRKVVVEGIYPMHPLSTYMLTQLSDYLQNRSSLTLVSEYISEVSLADLTKTIPCIMPERLMAGDLYKEMLSAETEGRQASQHCIRFDNIMRKYGDKLSEQSIMVLRSNLILRILRFRTQSYGEVKEALILCCGLSMEEIENELNWLENEYAILGFDEHAGCFDFMEDSRGAHDYKIQKKRLIAGWRPDFRGLLRNAGILDIANLSAVQQTNFGLNHKILTNEWCFIQDIYLVEDFTEDMAIRYIQSWKESCSSAEPKGRLIWLYINKDTNDAELERIMAFSALFERLPIVVMLLNDIENRLAHALVDYDVLNSMDESIRTVYDRPFKDDFSQSEANLKSEFEDLKKKRLYLTPDGVKTMGERLPIFLTKIFENIYWKAVPFNFDGLLTKSNNLGGKGSLYFCSIIRMLLSNNVSFDTIHDFSQDTRNRISAVLMTTSTTSWRCISASGDECHIIPPEEKNVRIIYDQIIEELYSNKEYPCNKMFDTFCAPPYGLNEEAITLLLSVILANQYFCVRIKCDEEQTGIIKWKDKVVIKDKRIASDIIKRSVLLFVDTGAIEARFQQLFTKIEANRDLGGLNFLRKELEKLQGSYDIPKNLEMNYKLAQLTLSKGEQARQKWDINLVEVEDAYDEAVENTNVYSALLSLEKLRTIPVKEIFSDNGYDFTDEYKKRLQDQTDRMEEFIKQTFDLWVETGFHCKSIEAMTQYNKHITRTCDLLTRLGYPEFAKKVREKGDKELKNKEEIRSRQDLLKDCDQYISDIKELGIHITYVSYKSLIKRGKNLLDRLKKYGSSIGKEAIKYQSDIGEKVGVFVSRAERIEKDMTDIWNDLDTADTYEDIVVLVECIDLVLQKGIPEQDQKDFIDLKQNLSSFISDIEELKIAMNNLDEFTDMCIEFRKRYKECKNEFDFTCILDECIMAFQNEINEKERIWIEKNLNLGDGSRMAIYKWKDRIINLPLYLSKGTRQRVQELDLKAEEVLSVGRIEDVIICFERLTMVEKKICLDMIQERLT